MRRSTRWWLGLVLLAIPTVAFVPGIGLESGRPADLARRSGPDGTWYYRVAEGDVLSRIAERELGAHLRYREILGLNPGLKPRSIRPGTVLRMPARVPPAGSAEGAAAAGTGADAPPSRDLLLACAALLGLLILVVVAAGRVERRRQEA